ncbi:MAG: hypothetical protein ABN482_13715 [Corticimicrobacter sp.]|uniref:hypothetical protein n=1 Tax=Corticimicrobacter sp. TaxID=2678536 RepID=UPI0032DB7E7C
MKKIGSALVLAAMMGLGTQVAASGLPSKVDRGIIRFQGQIVEGATCRPQVSNRAAVLQVSAACSDQRVMQRAPGRQAGDEVMIDVRDIPARDGRQDVRRQLVTLTYR